MADTIQVKAFQFYRPHIGIAGLNAGIKEVNEFLSDKKVDDIVSITLNTPTDIEEGAIFVVYKEGAKKWSTHCS